MQVIITYEEYVDLQARASDKASFEAWKLNVENAQMDCCKSIIKMIGPYLNLDPFRTYDPVNLRHQLQEAFKPLNDEIEKLTKHKV